MEFHDMLIRIAEMLQARIQRIRELAVERSAAPDLTLSMLAYLEALDRMSCPTPSTLSAYLGVSKASVSAGVASLERSGLVTRLLSEDDGRVKYIRLSGAGTDLIVAESAAFRELAGEITQMLTDKENQALRSILTKIITASPR